MSRGEFSTNNPYEIYSRDQEASPHLMQMMEHPAVFAGSLAAEMFLSPFIVRSKVMGPLMGQSGRAGRNTFWETMREAKKHYGARSIGRSNFGKYLRSASPSQLGFSSTASTYMGQQEEFGKFLGGKFGEKAATRIRWSRGIQGMSRFVGSYFMVHMGISAIRGLADMVNDYEAPDPSRPGSRDIETGGMYVDTRAAQTQRARAMQAIHNTQLSTRAALSNEAAFMHFNR